MTNYLKDEKIKSIKAICEVCLLDLYDAKRAIEKIPCIISKNKKLNEAQNIKSKLESLGLSATINPSNSYSDNNIFDLSIISCPRCGSTSITTGQKGYSFWTGFFGSNKTVNRCGKCGYSWEPKQ